MADVVIHHCTLRLRRRNGWSWGSDPRRLLDLAVRALPALLAQRLAALWPEDVDEEIYTPLTLRIPINLNEATSLLAQLTSIDPAIASQTELARRIETVVNMVFHAAQLLPSEPEPAAEVFAGQAVGEVSDAAHPHRIKTAIQLLLKWRSQGTLETLLAGFSPASLEAWHRHVLSDANPDRFEPPYVTLAQIEEFIIHSVEKTKRVQLDRAARLRRRLFLAVDVAEKFRLATLNAQIVNAIDRVLPLTVGTPVTDLSAVGESPSIAQSPQPHAPETIVPVKDVSQLISLTRRSIPSLRVEGEVRVSSALPFLLLGPLARIGYLEALGATLETSELGTQSSLFAVALAYKVLEPPERGWRRTPGSIKTATAFAGLNEPPPEESFTEFALRISAHLSPLHTLLRLSLSEGHQLGEPLLLHAADEGLALMDVDGSFPIAWSRNVDEMVSILVPFGTNVCLIPRAAAEPELLKKLHAANVLFVTDAPPTRSEDWRVLRRGNKRWWTNDQASAPVSLLRAARQLAAASASAEELWRQFGAERPSVPLSARRELDRHLTLAASVALGTIAWTLWRRNEATTPHMALSRFSDFEARVRLARDAVRVYLPRGRRFQDLLDHRLLAPVSNVPWLGGRPIEFVGG